MFGAATSPPNYRVVLILIFYELNLQMQGS